MEAGKPNPTQVASGAGPQLVSEKLFLLGLQLLARNTAKIPCAVVQPRLQSKTSVSGNDAESPQSPLKPDPVNIPTSPQQHVPDGSRKRKRGAGSELTGVERREKRKLMNRVAAQTARDRKKDFVSELERKVEMLEAKNRELQEENRLLRQQTDTLASEKWQLEKQLKHRDQTRITCDWFQPPGKRGTSESGSAVPITPLQQEQILRALLALVLATLSLIHWVTFCKTTCQDLPTHMHHMTQCVESRASHVTSWLDTHPPLRKPAWWGSAQSTWNPPKN